MDQTTSNLLEAPADIITTDDTLKEINGEGGAYSNEAASLNRLAEMEFLVLPAGLPIPEVPFEEVGTKKARDYFSPVYVLAVYILNKAICADTTNNNNVRFGLARTEAVMLGWFSDQRKVKMETVPNDFMALVAADNDLITKLLAPARDAAWLIPLAAEYIFRSKGHHYTPAWKSDYIKRCDSIFKASMKPDVGTFLPSDLLYHYTFHWITPARIWKVMKAHEDSGLPDTIKLRMTCSPVGAALVTTTAAVLKPFSAGGFLDDLLALIITKIDKILELDATIRSIPTVYHMNPTAYGEAFLAAGPRKEFEDGKEEAKKLAPVLQAFCDTMLRNAPLGRQKILRKHANSNPALRQSAKRFFQEFCREVPTSLDEVFISQLKKSKATIEDPSGADDNPASLRQGAKRLFHEVGRGVPTSLAEVFGQKKKSKAAIENPSGLNESG